LVFGKHFLSGLYDISKDNAKNSPSYRFQSLL